MGKISFKENNFKSSSEEGKTTLVELNNLAEPLLLSDAFTRLSKISFLGILSPYFSYLPKYPFRKQSCNNFPFENIDGSRADHSIAVSNIFLHISNNIQLSEMAKRYSIAWGLTHDISTFALSHTSEAAFSNIAGINSKQLRKMMIMGDKKLPSSLSVNKELKEIGVDPLLLMKLFEKKSIDLNKELHLLKLIIHSPITPDTLEGMHRTGHIFGIDVTNPYEMAKVISKDMYDLFIQQKDSSQVLKFWRDKSKIYSYINSYRATLFESDWSLAIEKNYRKKNSCVDLLNLAEQDIIQFINNNELTYHGIIRKYKPPLDYKVSPEKKRVIDNNQLLTQLSDFLVKTEKSTLSTQ